MPSGFLHHQGLAVVSPAGARWTQECAQARRDRQVTPPAAKPQSATHSRARRDPLQTGIPYVVPTRRFTPTIGYSRYVSALHLQKSNWLAMGMKIPPPSRIAFPSERGAFSEEAAVKLLGEDIQLVPRATFEALYSSIIDSRRGLHFLAPIENSLAGSVHRSYDLLISSGLHIQAEVVIPIAHYLIGVPGATFEAHHTSLLSSRSARAVRTILREPPQASSAWRPTTLPEACAKRWPPPTQPGRGIASKARGESLRRADSPRASRGSPGKLHAFPAAGDLSRDRLKTRTSFHFRPVPSRTKPGSLCSALGAFAETQSESAEDREPPDSRHALELLLLPRSAGVTERSAHTHSFGRVETVHRFRKGPRLLPPGKRLSARWWRRRPAGGLVATAKKRRRDAGATKPPRQRPKKRARKSRCHKAVRPGDQLALVARPVIIGVD